MGRRTHEDGVIVTDVWEILVSDGCVVKAVEMPSPTPLTATPGHWEPSSRFPPAESAAFLGVPLSPVSGSSSDLPGCHNPGPQASGPKPPTYK